MQSDRFDVLAADVDDGADARVQAKRANGVARDLRDILIGKRHLVSAVAGANEVAQGIQRNTRTLASLVERGARRELRIDSAWNDRGSHDLASIQNHGFAGGRADIAASGMFGKHARHQKLLGCRSARMTVSMNVSTCARMPSAGTTRESDRS